MLNTDFNPIRMLLSFFAEPDDDDTIILDPEDMDTEQLQVYNVSEEVA